jgi:hypothetical protein
LVSSDLFDPKLGLLIPRFPNIGLFSPDTSFPKNPMFGKTPANAKPVIVNGVKYASVNKAAAALKLTPYKVYKIIKEENYDNF